MVIPDFAWEALKHYMKISDSPGYINQEDPNVFNKEIIDYLLKNKLIQKRGHYGVVSYYDVLLYPTKYKITTKGRKAYLKRTREG